MQDSIVIRGAREHNLKNINVSIPRDQLVVITGLSGSGKSSLAFDTIYAEGQRRYVESLSAYARQFLGQMNKPDIDHIDGLSPAVSIDQKTTSKNPRSTVGTVTEIYDYLRLLFARIGIPHCPECGREIVRQTTDQVVDRILEMGEGRRAHILAPIVRGRKGEYGKLFTDLHREGFARVRVDGEVRQLAEKIDLDKKFKHDIEVIVDRIVLKRDATTRLAEAVEIATRLADGNVIVQLLEDEAAGLPAGEEGFSLALACPVHGHSLDDLEPRDFSFNAPYGACPSCLGLGFTHEVDPSLIIPDPSLSLEEGAWVVFSTASNYWPQVLRSVARHLGVTTETPFEEYPKAVQDAFLHGLGNERIRVDYVTRDGRDTHWGITFPGLVKATSDRYEESTSESSKARFEEYFAISPCSACGGARLKPEILAVTIGQKTASQKTASQKSATQKTATPTTAEQKPSTQKPTTKKPSTQKNIYEITQLSARDGLAFFEDLALTPREEQIGGRVIKEIRERLRFLVDVGLDYLTLDRATATLSGGEAQRIRLATQIGAGLMGVLYILDEPSIGLHQRDNERLIATLERLRDLGNTVIVVEHDEETIRSADYVIDIGPGAGEHGGRIIAQGPPVDILNASDSLTADYLSGRREIPIPAERRSLGKGSLIITGAAENNLKNISAEIELGTLTVVTGVSGSGKSSLITDTLAPALTNRIHRSHKRVGTYEKLSGISLLDKVIDIDQSPIGRTPRSNPATYVGLWDDVRNLFSQLPESKARGYAPGRFSFNVSGGRCEACKGDGQIKIEMHFLPDIYVPCEVCKGARYNRETLQVTYRGKSVADVLDMSVEEALRFFESLPRLKRKLQTLYDVGLGYIKLGQPATTLSGGEAQRVKLASELQRVQTGNTFYILDEPTTGLHFDDVRQLLEVLQRLVEKGNTVLVIEHNLDVIKCADRIIDLGPEGGDKGGRVVACGSPEEVARCKESYTGHFLQMVFAKAGHAF
ncbi:MAG: excinuclease ABC subunit UvrA [Coriobacteriales bacterium]|jgi:excinuclease ABC subunit A|nr:excinuclease ABC subunit UvrA [Coriobacteriales bacterium]